MTAIDILCGRGSAGVLAAWVDGKPCREVSVLDRGLHFGDGLFETMAVRNGAIRLVDLHLARLQRGCARLGLRLPDARGVLEQWRRAAAGRERAVLKVLVTRGPAVRRGYATGDAPATQVMLLYEAPADEGAADGVRVRLGILRLGENPALAGLKHCNRLEQVLARREWDDLRIADSLLFSSTGALISGTMTNVFLVKDSRVLTPRLDRCGVAGVMRAAVMEACAQGRVAVVETRLTAADLDAAQEILLTNALTGVRPVSDLAGRTLTPGRVTRQVQELLAARLAADTAGVADTGASR
ncbi:MAG: aminodeoxychorismate lyase [Proteobacteria bacterium]|nr:aminodeoxychorismate lyase [Pseudomonadota bacterium]